MLPRRAMDRVSFYPGMHQAIGSSRIDFTHNEAARIDIEDR